MDNRKVTLSIVLPCHNEEEVLIDTYDRLSKLLQKWMESIILNYEIIMVNNGSTDNTLSVMKSLQKKDKNIVILDLRKNFGYQASITAGLYNASEEVVVSIDADLQDDPEKIQEMIQKYKEGYDLVLGVRNDRQSDNFFKRSTAHLYYKMLKLLGVNSVPNHGDFRLISRFLLNDLKQYKERNRYLRALIFEVESKYACVYYKRAPRTAGTTKFKPLNLFSLAWEGISSFSSTPVKLVLFFSLLMFAVSIAGIFYVLIVKYVFQQSVPGWASLLTLFLFFGGVQNLFLGIIGEYISKIFIEVKQRPIFLIREKYEYKNQKKNQK